MILDTKFPLDIIRTDRTKSASIQISDGVVKVLVPKNLSDERVQSLVARRTPWIRQKLKIQSETVAPKPKEYVNGESFTYLGRNFRLKIVSEGPEGVKLKNGYFARRLCPTTSLTPNRTCL
jgi:predicted metal-dependent hydrolase